MERVIALRLKREAMIRLRMADIKLGLDFESWST